MKAARPTFLLALAWAVPALGQGYPPQPAPPPPTIQSATQVTAQDQAFFAQIKQAIATNNQQWLGSVLAYPLKVRLRSGIGLVHNPTEFEQSYDQIIDGTVRQAVTFQNPAALQKTLAGVSVGSGQIWFRQTVYTIHGMVTAQYRITAINN